MMMQDEGRVMDGLSPYNWATYIPERDLQAIQNGTWKGTNWLKEVLNEDALVQNHAVNITGGTDRSRYAIGISYTNQRSHHGSSRRISRNEPLQLPRQLGPRSYEKGILTS